MELRYYQTEAVESIFTYFASNDGNPIVAMPTGTGKSVVIAEFLRIAFCSYPGVRQQIIMLTHVQELIEQNFEKLLAVWPSAPAGIYSAGLDRREIASITYAGIASVYKLAAQFGFVDMLMIDEAHLVGDKESSMYGIFIGQLKEINPKLKVVGLSATPYRLGMGKLIEGSLFTDICYDITSLQRFNQLVAEGWIAPLIPKRMKEVLDVTGVKISGGEFVASQLQAAVNKRDITYRALQETMLYGQDRHSWLIFTTGIEHTEDVAEMLWTEFAVDAYPIHSKTKPEARRQAIFDFKAGRKRCLVNNNVLTVGFDHPGIDLIGVLRPTNSPTLWVQMLGRGTRPSPGKKNCLVLDFARNTKKLGPINDPVLPRKKGGGGGGGMAPIKTCAICSTENHASVTYCISCGEEFYRGVKFGDTADDRELIAGDIEKPVHEVFRVDRITYAIHKKRASYGKDDGAERPDCVRASYFCGLRKFDEYLHFEHPGLPGHRAHKWWRDRFTGQEQSPMNLRWVPSTCAEAVHYHTYLKAPTHIKVWVNRKHPEIINHDFTGSGFAAL